MNKLIVYFEIDGIGVCEDGTPCPTGMKLEFGESEHPIDYDELTKSINIPYMLKCFGLQDDIKPEMLRVISPEEYEKEYGVDD